MPRASRQRILDAAERLFAHHGIAAVSLREIIAAADHGNMSAVQYYFGSKRGLVRAIMAERERTLDRRRLALLAEAERQGRASDLRSLIEAIVGAFAESLHAGSCHARFYAQVFNDPAADHVPWTDLPAQPGIRRIIVRIRATLPHLPATLRTERLRFAWRLADTVFALHERDLEAGRRSAASAAVTANLADMMVGLLTAPVTSPRHRPTRSARTAAPTARGSSRS